jgi:molybdopterin converting factor small subunit
MKITFNGFGSARPLRGYTLELEAGVEIAKLRAGLVEQLANQPAYADLATILLSCAFASDQEVLHENSRIDSDQVLNILPPVCGG